jgi:CheY-like chemotaxis protein
MLARVLGETIRLECHAAPDLPSIKADESNLDQVIMNLAVNARDAMPNGGTLSLSAQPLTVTPAEAAAHPDRRSGEFVALTIRDTGCGMDAATLGRIFEPFFTTKPIGRGTGLGLSTVYGIVKQHEGWMEVQSEPGKGTTFRVFLPVTAEQAEPEPAAAPTPAQAVATNPNGTSIIMVVEDEPEVRNFITASLADKGYEVVQAASGADALLKWKETANRVRVLLTDMVMPDGISGSTLAQHLLRRNPQLKIIYTSGYSPDAVTQEDSLTEGLNFLSKPFTQDRLLEAVRHALAAGSPKPPA